MGAPGHPPSDGLTRNSAVINAVQRAVDNACHKLGFELIDPATPRSVRLSLDGPFSIPIELFPEHTFEHRNNAPMLSSRLTESKAIYYTILNRHHTGPLSNIC